MTGGGTAELGFLPPKLRGRLMQFQREGVAFALKKNGCCLIADEMGLGKTLQALSVAYYYKDRWPLLIIVPASLRYPWVEELEKWFPEINPHEINLIHTGADIHDIPTAKVTIVTYGLLRHRGGTVVREALMNQKFEVVIADESHYIKNRKCVSTKYIVPLIQQATHKVLLTGTPALGRPEELYPQIESIKPNLFGSWTMYSKRYCDAKMVFFGRMKQWRTDGASNLEELQRQLASDLMIRRLKKDVLTQLPKKQRQKIPFHLKDSELKKEMDKTWSSIGPLLKKNKMDIGQAMKGPSNPPASSVDNDASEFFKVRQLISELYRHTCKAKIGPVKEYVRMLIANEGLKMLVFAYHHYMMDGIMEEVHDAKVKFIRIDGSTPAVDRPRLVKQFQTDPQTRVAILSIKAAGVGLTLTAARLVVFAELNWTPGELEQCEDRAHRIGQTETVHVQYLVAKGTLDEWLWSALSRKTTIVTATLNGKKQVLRMDEGNKGDIDCLSNAEPWAPSQREPEEITAIFQSQESRAQKSLLDFFTPKTAKKRSRTKSGQNDDTSLILCDESAPSPVKKSKTENSTADHTLCGHDTTSKKDDVELNTSNDSPYSRDKNAPRRWQNREETQKIDSPKTGYKCDAVLEVTDADKARTPEGQGHRSRLKQLKVKGKVGINSSPFLPSCSTPNTGSPIIIDSDDDFQESPIASHQKSKPVKRRSFMIGNESPIVSPKRKHSVNLTGDTPRSQEDAPSEQSNHGNLSVNEGSVTEVSFANSANDDSFSMKRQKKRRKLLDSKWNCPMCTYLNHSAMKYCEICDCAKNADTSINTPHSKAEKQGRPITQPYKPAQTESSVNVVRKNNQSGPQDKETADSSLQSKYRTDVAHSEPAIKNEAEDDGTVCKFDSNNQSRSGNTEAMDEGISCKFGPDKGPRHAEREPARDNRSNSNNSSCAQISQSVNDDIVTETDENNEELDPLDEPTFEITIDDFSDDFSTDEALGQDTDQDIQEYTDSETATSSGTNRDRLQDKHKTLAKQQPLSSETSVSNQDHCEDFDDDDFDFGDDLMTDVAPQTPASSKASPGPGVNEDDGWRCGACGTKNWEADDECDGCFKARDVSENTGTAQKNQEKASANSTETEERVVDLAKIKVHSLFKYCSSKNTSRVYLLDREGVPLEVNFSPLDVEMENYPELPDLLLHPENFKLVRRFVREWNSLGATKQRVIIRSGAVFSNPCILYDELRTKPKLSCQRYTTKDDVAKEAEKKAEVIGGSTRVITKQTTLGQRSKVKEKEERKEDCEENTNDGQYKGITQVLDSEGRPLCLECYSPFTTDLVRSETIQDNAWQTRFCSPQCADQYWIQSHRQYGQQQVFELEHGVCQLCHINAQDFFTQIRSMTDLVKRANLIKNSKYDSLKADVKEKMVKKPYKGLFWQVDHIQAVADGGGQCDIDNLRTLCTVCHLEVTKKQNKERAQRKRHMQNSKFGDITAFFKKVS